MKVQFIIGFLALGISLFPQSIPHKYKNMDGKELNSLGFDYYESMDYEKAAEIFAYASIIDPTWEIPPFNRACSNALLLKGGGSIDMNEIISDLHRSFVLEPTRLAKIRNDSDLDSIRSSSEFKYLLEALSSKDNKIIFSQFPQGKFEYHNSYIYSSNFGVLVGHDNPENDEHWFIPLHHVEGIDLTADTRALIIGIYKADRENMESFEEMEEGANPSMFGDIKGVDSKTLHLLLYDMNTMKILSSGEITGQRPLDRMNIAELKRFTPADNTLSFTTWGFASGSYTQFWMVHFSTYGDIYTSDPIYWESEDLSGGAAPRSEYKDLRYENGYILIDMFIDGNRKKTIEILNLAY